MKNCTYETYDQPNSKNQQNSPEKNNNINNKKEVKGL